MTTTRLLLLDIMCPLCCVWENGSAEMHELKKYLILFIPDAYPNLLKWTTYPINATQKRLYKQLQAIWRSGRAPQELPAALIYYWTELLSVMDRCTAVGYTGSMHIIPKQLGTTMWFGIAIHSSLLLCFSSHIVEFLMDDEREGDWLKVHTVKWPLDPTTRHPLQSSGQTHEIEYGRMISPYRF